MLVDIAEFKIADWRFPETTSLVLRIIPNDTFLAEDGADGDLIEAEKFYGEVCVTVECDDFNGYSTPTLVIPPVKIQSTTDARMNRGATYRAEIWSTKKHKKIFTFQSLTQFRVPNITDRTITWGDIILFNTPLNISPIVSIDEQLKQLIYATVAGLDVTVNTGTPGFLSKFKPSGTGVEDSAIQDTGVALIPQSAYNLGNATDRFNIGYFNNLIVTGLILGNAEIAGNVTIDNNLSVIGTSAFGGAGVFQSQLQVQGNFIANNNAVFLGSLNGQSALFTDGSVGNGWHAALLTGGVDTVPGAFGVNGVVGRKLAMWDESVSGPLFQATVDLGEPVGFFFDTRNNHDTLILQRDASMVLDDGAYLLRAVGGGTLGQSGIGVNTQFYRQRSTDTSVPCQTLQRSKLVTVATGSSVPTIISNQVVSIGHPSGYDGENYSFRTVGDLAGVTSNHTIKININSTVIATRVITAGNDFKWEASGSITMIDTGTGEWLAEAKISDDDGNTIGYFSATGLSSLEGVSLQVTAEDDATGETRGIFSEFFHNDWKA